MSVKVTTEVAEVEASKTPSDEQDQVRTHVSLMMLLVVRPPLLRIMIVSSND